MALQCLLHEPQSSRFVAGFGDVALQDLAFMIDCPPQLNHLAVEADIHLVKVPSPMPEALHPVHALPANARGEHRPKAISPVTRGLAADVAAALQ